MCNKVNYDTCYPDTVCHHQTISEIANNSCQMSFMMLKCLHLHISPSSVRKCNQNDPLVFHKIYIQICKMQTLVPDFVSEGTVCELGT